MRRFLTKYMEKMMENGTKVGADRGEKHAKFRDLAESRTNKAIDAIGRLGNLSNRSLYEWDEVEVKRVLKALRDAISDVESRFASPKGKASSKFKL